MFTVCVYFFLFWLAQFDKLNHFLHPAKIIYNEIIIVSFLINHFILLYGLYTPKGKNKMVNTLYT